jgi:hypothetical protein
MPETLMVAVGVPGEDIDGVADAGRVQVFGAASNPVTPTGVELMRSSSAMPGTPQRQELIGADLGASADTLYVASPYWAGGTVYGYRWSQLPQIRVPAIILKAGAGGIPAGTAFGAGIS